MNAGMKTASDMRKPRKEDSKPAISASPLPEAYIKAHSAPVVACGELAFEVWETYDLPKAERK